MYLVAGTGSPVTELHFERQIISMAAESVRVMGVRGEQLCILITRQSLRPHEGGWWWLGGGRVGWCIRRVCLALS